MSTPAEVTIKVNGKEYVTVFDDEGVQRFKVNTLFRYLTGSTIVDYRHLSFAYQQGEFTQEEYLHFLMGVGWSVSGLFDLDAFKDLPIENPVWKKS